MAGLKSRASTTPKFAPKPGENGAKIESFPVFCFERLDRIDGNGEIRNCLDWLKFWIAFIFSGVNSYAKYRKEVDFPISFKNLRGPVAGNKLQHCTWLSYQSDTLQFLSYFITRQGFIQQTWIKPFQIIPAVHLTNAKKRHNFKSKNLIKAQSSWAIKQSLKFHQANIKPILICNLMYINFSLSCTRL